MRRLLIKYFAAENALKNTTHNGYNKKYKST